VVTGNNIVFNSATSAASAATSTAAQMITAIQASAPASALVTVAAVNPSTGVGVVVAVAATNLSGGGLPTATIATFTVTSITARTLLVTFQCSQACIWWVQLDMQATPTWRQQEFPVVPRQVAATTMDTVTVSGLRPGALYHVRATCRGLFGTVNSTPTTATMLASPNNP
jgi:hypothetical protein